MIYNLPDEILLKILSHLDEPAEIFSTRSVCHRFRNMIQDKSFWNGKLHRALTWKKKPSFLKELLVTREMGLVFLANHVGSFWGTLSEVTAQYGMPDVASLQSRMEKRVYKIVDREIGPFGLGFKTEEITAFLFLYQDPAKPHWSMSYSISSENTFSQGALMQSGRLDPLGASLYESIFRTQLPTLLTK